jgi:drug/metabolite transporter (DMT)-like permease
MKETANITRAYTYALAAVFGWSTVATAFKITLGFLSVSELLFYSALTSIAVLYPLHLKNGSNLSLPPWRNCLQIGLLVPSTYYLVLFQAYSILPAQHAQALNYSWPLAMSILAIFLLDQKISVRKLSGLLVGFSGLVLICLSRGSLASLSHSDGLGMILAIGSALFWGTYWILMLRSPYSPPSFLLGGFLGSLPFLSIALIASGPVRIPPLEGLLGAAYIGVFEMGLTFFLWSKALQMAGRVASIANLAYFSPFLSLVWIYLFLGEKLEILAIIGLIVLVSAVLISREPGGLVTEN